MPPVPARAARGEGGEYYGGIGGAAGGNGISAGGVIKLLFIINPCPREQQPAKFLEVFTIASLPGLDISLLDPIESHQLVPV